NARRAEPRDPLAVALSCVFFLSGAAGLFYEVIFAKSLALTFGSTANASTAVLAIYMAGMALGSWIGGLLAARLGRTLAAYAVCAGYLALPHLGIVRTTFLAVLANVLAGLFGMLLVARAKAAAAAVVAPEPLAAPPPPADRRLGIAALVILAVGGAATFALETT